MIRAAEQSDAADIADLWNWMIRDTSATFTTVEKKLSEIGALIDDPERRFFVSVDVGAVRGFVTFGAFRAGPGYATTCEHSIVVLPGFQGQKIGAALMATAIKVAQTLGRREMVAAISSANPRAVGFHEQIGFAKVGHMPRVGFKSGQWLDLILMQKNLSECG